MSNDIFNYQSKHYPVEYLIFYTFTLEDAYDYLKHNEIWTDALSLYKGFISATSYLVKNDPFEIHIVVIWENLEDWLAISIDELKKIDHQFKQSYNKEFKSGPRLHNVHNFGWYKVSQLTKKSIKT